MARSLAEEKDLGETQRLKGAKSEVHIVNGPGNHNGFRCYSLQITTFPVYTLTINRLAIGLDH